MSLNKYLLPFILLCCSAATGYAQTQANLIPKKGLVIETSGLAWGLGSEINFFTLDRKQHHYYFTWWEQDEVRHQPNDVELILGSHNTAVYGSFRMTQVADKIQASIDCKWNRSDTGLVEITYLRLWKPYFHEAIWKDAKGKRITEWKEFEGNKIIAETPFGKFVFSSTASFKARTSENPYPTELTQRNQYLEFYVDKIAVDSTHRLQREFSLQVSGEQASTGLRTGMNYVRDTSKIIQWKPLTSRRTILPLPAELQYYPGYYVLPLKGNGTPSNTESDLRALIALQWQLKEEHYPKAYAQIDTQLSTQAYRIEVSKHSIRIEYGSDTALQYALQTLVQSVEVQNGRVLIPCMKIADQPKSDWRGIHMFTGPTALDFHKRMYERVLFPLKMNKTVIQCEQARWTAFTDIHNTISVPLADLKKEFELLRRNRVEPIPLIQSLGHMEWFFKPKSTRWLAINPDYPYTLNADLPQAKEAIQKIWDEAIDLLQPNTLHVGFDEIGMIGFNQPRDKEVRLFRDQLSLLDRYAKTKNKRLMIWGDMGLAPGEGPDACNGINPNRAKTIRDAIPPGTFVADWHYLNNPDPAVYKKSLQIWKQNQNIPLASPWLWPNNVHGFVKAAIDEKAGVLQTTWADFESSEKNMLLNIEQFGAYILALDYAWSGRKELPTQLTYDPNREWSKRFYDQAKPLASRTATVIADSISLKDITSKADKSRYDGISLIFDKPHDNSGLTFRATTQSILPEATLVAEIELYHKDIPIRTIPIRYGVEVRSENDRRPIHAALEEQDPKTLWRFWDRSNKIDLVRIKEKHPGSGLILRDIALID